MKACYLLFIFLLGTAISLKAQQPDSASAPKETKKTEVVQKKPMFGITFSGFVKTDLFYDSRQTISARDGHFLLFPENEKLDAEGNDIYAKASYNFLSIQTRLAGSITGPDALGARTSGYIEAEFFGNINPNINTFRLRHAWVKLNWKTTELLVGQWWHPMFVPECSPATVSFNTGAPFVVFSRNPQVKLTQSAGNFKFSLTFLSQVDFMSDGPEGLSTKYIRNAVIPESDFQIQYVKINSAKQREFMIGAGINYQLLTPRLSTTVTLQPAFDTVINNIVVHYDAVTANYKTSEKTTALACNFYVKYRCKPITAKMGAEYGGNNNAYTMLGGYAVKSITDSVKGTVNYTNIRSYAVWAEVHTNGIRWQTGIFAAFGKNLGADEPYTGAVYTRGGNINYAYRVSPRLVFNAGKFRLAGELEYTAAAYGKTIDRGFVAEPKEVGNLRVLIGVYYFF